MKKCDMDAYIIRRTKELRGEKVYSEPTDDEILRYTRQRMRDLSQREESQRDLDRSPLGCYTLRTMGDRHGET